MSYVVVRTSSESARDCASVNHRLSLRLSANQSRVDIPSRCEGRSATSLRDGCVFWIPEGCCVVHNEAKAIGVLSRGTNLDANVRRVMPEYKPANACEDQVDTEQGITLVSNDADDALFVLVDLIVDQLLDDVLHVLRRRPKGCDCAKHFFFEPVVKDYNADQSDSSLKKS